MFSALRKIISFLTLATTLVIAVKELKIAIDAIRKHVKESKAA